MLPLRSPPLLVGLRKIRGNYAKPGHGPRLTKKRAGYDVMSEDGRVFLRVPMSEAMKH